MCNLRQGLKIKRPFADGKFLFLEGGGGETCVFYLLVFNIFFFWLHFVFLCCICVLMRVNFSHLTDQRRSDISVYSVQTSGDISGSFIYDCYFF